MTPCTSRARLQHYSPAAGPRARPVLTDCYPGEEPQQPDRRGRLSAVRRAAAGPAPRLPGMMRSRMTRVPLLGPWPAAGSMTRMLHVPGCAGRGATGRRWQRTRMFLARTQRATAAGAPIPTSFKIGGQAGAGY